MQQEIDLLCNYPKTKRNLDERAQEKTDEDRAIARQFGKDFFDGDRRHGYGGFHYHERFWTPVFPSFQEFYNIKTPFSLLDIGCAKGFMLYDFARQMDGLNVAGIDISDYAIDNAIDAMKPFMQVGDARQLPFADNSFDLVISINTLHNLTRDEMAIALQEIMRVTRKDAFITIDAYRNETEQKRMIQWNLTAKTIMSVDEWIDFFQECGYTGDYYWFIP